MRKIEKELLIEIAVYLRTKRKLRGLSMEKVASALGYSGISFINRIEHGKNQIPIDKIDDFARVYGFEVTAFRRLILSVLYPDIFNLITTMLVEDENFAKLAHRCHSSQDPRKRERRRKEVSDVRIHALNQMRELLLKYKDVYPDNVKQALSVLREKD